MNSHASHLEQFVTTRIARCIDLALRHLGQTVVGNPGPEELRCVERSRTAGIPRPRPLANGLDQIAGGRRTWKYNPWRRFLWRAPQNRVVVHAEHDDAGCPSRATGFVRASSKPEHAGKLISSTQMSAARRRMPPRRFGVRGPTTAMSGSPPQRRATRSNDRMVVNDQDTQRHRSESPSATSRENQFCSANKPRCAASMLDVPRYPSP